MKTVRYIVCAAAALALTAVGILVLLAPQPTAVAAPISARSTTGVHDRMYSFAVAGDSITAYDNHEMPACAAACVLPERTWTHWAVSDDLRFAGGYAESGNKSWETAARMPNVEADILVVALGTNNATAGADPTVLVADEARIIATAGVRMVLIVAIPPHALAEELAQANNLALRSFAEANGYGWVDPWVSFRVGAGWAVGVSADGIHPAQVSSFEIAGRRISAAMMAMLQKTQCVLDCGHI